MNPPKLNKIIKQTGPKERNIEDIKQRSIIRQQSLLISDLRKSIENYKNKEKKLLEFIESTLI